MKLALDGNTGSYFTASAYDCRRILCFETSNTTTTPRRAVKNIYKALIAAADLFVEGIVMTPLLSTGAQVCQTSV